MPYGSLMAQIWQFKDGVQRGDGGDLNDATRTAMTVGTSSLERELEDEIRDFELSMARLEGGLEEKRSLLSRLRQVTHYTQEPAAPVAPAAPIAPAAVAASTPAGDGAAGGGRRSISALGKHHYEVDGLRFPNAGQMLDHLDVPHYFSRKYPKQGDAAAREVMRWAKRNPFVARRVSVVLAGGARMGLDAAVNEIRPQAPNDGLSASSRQP